MAQAGIHALVGAAVRRWILQNERREGRANGTWLVLGVFLGNLLPDADNLGLAVWVTIRMRETLEVVTNKNVVEVSF